MQLRMQNKPHIFAWPVELLRDLFSYYVVCWSESLDV